MGAKAGGNLCNLSDFETQGEEHQVDDKPSIRT